MCPVIPPLSILSFHKPLNFNLTQIAGFATTEADQFFGKPDPSLIEGLRIDLRPPKQVRKAYIDRHLSLLRLL